MPLIYVIGMDIGRTIADAFMDVGVPSESIKYHKHLREYKGLIFAVRNCPISTCTLRPFSLGLLLAAD
jgi:hypothetical protein